MGVMGSQLRWEMQAINSSDGLEILRKGLSKAGIEMIAGEAQA